MRNNEKFVFPYALKYFVNLNNQVETLIILYFLASKGQNIKINSPLHLLIRICILKTFY